MERIMCPHCGKVVANDGRLAGQVAVCPGCHGQFQMPSLPAVKKAIAKVPSSKSTDEGDMPFVFMVVLAAFVMVVAAITLMPEAGENHALTKKEQVITTEEIENHLEKNQEEFRELKDRTTTDERRRVSNGFVSTPSPTDPTLSRSTDAGLENSALRDEPEKTWLYSTPEASVTLKSVAITLSPEVVHDWNRHKKNLATITESLDADVRRELLPELNISLYKYIEKNNVPNEGNALKALFVFENKTSRKRMTVNSRSTYGNSSIHLSMYEMMDDVNNRYRREMEFEFDGSQPQSVPPGKSVEQEIYFECPPKDTKSLKIKYDSKGFSSGSGKIFENDLVFLVDWSKVKK